MKKGQAVTDNPQSNEITPQDIFREVYGELPHFEVQKRTEKIKAVNPSKPFEGLQKHFDVEFGPDPNPNELPF